MSCGVMTQQSYISAQHSSALMIMKTIENPSVLDLCVTVTVQLAVRCLPRGDHPQPGDRPPHTRPWPGVVRRSRGLQGGHRGSRKAGEPVAVSS